MIKNENRLTIKIVLFSFLIVFVLSNFSLVFATPTTATIEIKPNPVGIEQSILVCLRVEPSPTEAGIESASWEGITVEVTRPTGTITTIGPISTDATGIAYFNFIPDMPGHWTFQMSFPGQTSSGEDYDPSESEAGLDVQQDPVEYQSEDLTCDFLEEEDPCLIWKILVAILIIIILILLWLLSRRR